MSAAPPPPAEGPPREARAGAASASARTATASTAPPSSIPRSAQIKEHLTYGKRVIVDAHLAPPAADHRVRRFLWGFALPFGVLREVLRDPGSRKRWLEIAGAQLLIIFAMTFVAVHFSRDSSDGLAGAVATVYTVVCAVEWIVIALSREYHDELSARAAWATRVPCEPASPHPRVHVDFAWLWMKAKRRIRGVLLVASGAPILAFALFVPRAGQYLYAGATGLWAFYWLCVFAVGATSIAWAAEPPPPSPWFLRPFDAAGRIPVFGLPFRAYGWLWRKLSSGVHSPCEAHAQAFYEGAGLALARLLTGVPGVYLFLRPLFPVAATHVALARYASVSASASASAGQ